MDAVHVIFRQQAESCAICEKHWTACEKSKHSRYDDVFLQYLYVDHCHKSGKVRGLLCNKCNTAIAMFDERLERLDAAKRYLLQHRAE